jgi:hypothetical protein
MENVTVVMQKKYQHLMSRLRYTYPQVTLPHCTKQILERNRKKRYKAFTAHDLTTDLQRDDLLTWYLARRKTNVLDETI